MKRSNAILVIVLVVLVGAAYLVLQRPGEESSASSVGEPLLAVDSAAAQKIEISSPSSRVELEKKGAEWFLVRPVAYHADQPGVAALLQKSKDLRVKGIVSNNPEKYGVYQVDSTGTRVTVGGPAGSTSFIVGKTGATGDTYVRGANSSDVAMIDGAVRYLFDRPVRDWRDKTIIAVPREKITEIRYWFGDTTFAVTKPDSVWRTNRGPVKEDVVDGVLSSLTNFQADDFDDETVSGNQKPTARIAYAGVEIRFTFNKLQNRYIVQSSSSPQRFILDSWKANQVLKREKEFAGR